MKRYFITDCENCGQHQVHANNYYKIHNSIQNFQFSLNNCKA